ncbi:MAG TPA: hypothetical protein VKX28_27035 [Xanthobacteraceae bacterium]|nr:hypothetical protein [Xanthobacteraceae bacterium]
MIALGASCLLCGFFAGSLAGAIASRAWGPAPEGAIKGFMLAAACGLVMVAATLIQTGALTP